MDRMTAIVILWLGLFSTFAIIVIALLIYSYKIRKLPTRITTTTQTRVPPTHMWESSTTRTTTTTPVKSEDEPA